MCEDRAIKVEGSMGEGKVLLPPPLLAYVRIAQDHQMHILFMMKDNIQFMELCIFRLQAFLVVTL